MPTHIRLSPERIHQLTRIAEAKGLTVADLIADYIRREIAAGVIPADIPYVEVEAGDERLTIRAPDFEAAVPVQEVPALIQRLRDINAHAAAKDAGRSHRMFEAAAALSGIQLVRMAGGVRLKSPITGETYPLASGLAEDLADQVARAVEK